MTSTPVYTSTAEGFRDAKEIAGLRAIPEARPRAPRKQAEKRVVSSGMVCFCGERFSEAQALEFMKHLRAEVGGELAVLERVRAAHRVANMSAEQRNRKRSGDRIENMSSERITRKRERNREHFRDRYADDPEYRERKLESGRKYRNDPENLARKAAKQRERYARKKAEREEAGTMPGPASSLCLPGKGTRSV